MVALSFSFPKLLLKLYTGEKCQTIRVRNPVRIEQMQRLGIQLYWKQRSPYGFRLYETKYQEGFIIKFIKPNCGFNYKYSLQQWFCKYWTGVVSWERELIAVADGFKDYTELVDALESRYGNLLNMEFDVIRWNPRKPQPNILLKWKTQMKILGLIKHSNDVQWMENYVRSPDR